MNAVVVGGTGLVGYQLIKKLFEDEAFKKATSVSRSPLKTRSSKLVEVLIADLTQLPAQTDKLKGDVYFCCLGTTIKTAGSKENFRKVDYDAIMAFGQIAKAHQAQSLLLVSAAGANSKSTFFYNQIKGEAEESLKKLNLKSFIIYRPSLLMGERQEFRPAEKFAMAIAGPLSIVLPTKVQKLLMTQVSTLTDAMIRDAKSPSSGVKVVGPTQI